MAKIVILFDEFFGSEFLSAIGNFGNDFYVASNTHIRREQTHTHIYIEQQSTHI